MRFRVEIFRDVPNSESKGVALVIEDNNLELMFSPYMQTTLLKAYAERIEQDDARAQMIIKNKSEEVMKRRGSHSI